MTPSEYLTAHQAADELGVSLATVYAYVSRGLIRSEPTNSQKRQRSYRREDIQHLKERKEQRRDPAKTVQEALHWGAPLLESGLTLIRAGRLYYRGQDATRLALACSLEQVAALLWTGDLDADLQAQPGPMDHLELAPILSMIEIGKGLAYLEAFQMALVMAEAQDPSAYHLRAEAVISKGLAILRLLAGLAAGKALQGGVKISQALQTSWAPDQPEAAGLINAALVLSADHELNVSSFTARCVASAGSSPYAAVIAGIAAMQGVRHGGMSARVDALFKEVDQAKRARTVLSARLKRGDGLPGFGHLLYPQGDPRAHLLIELVQQSLPGSTALELAESIASAALELMGEFPTIDFALVVLSKSLGLPDGAPIALFTLGRTVGWLAHAIEQYQSDQLIRPRARYIGPQPA